MFPVADAGAIHGLTLAGAIHVFIPSFDPEETLSAIERHRIDVVVLVPPMLNMVMNHPNFDRYDLSSLKCILYGASPMPLPLLRQAMSKMPCEFVQGYGMTEVSGILTLLGFADHRFENTDRQFAPVKSAGKAAQCVEIRVVDHQDNEVPAAEVSEEAARGPNMMEGYWNQPASSSPGVRGGSLHTRAPGALEEARL